MLHSPARRHLVAPGAPGCPGCPRPARARGAGRSRTGAAALVAAITAVALVGGRAPATGAAAGRPADAAASADALVLHSAGLAALMPDERDASLRRAFALLPDRLMELEGELPDAPALPEPLVRALVAGLASPMTLSVDVPDPAEGGPPIRLQLAIQPEDPAVARRLGEVMGGLLRDQGIELQPIEGTDLAGTPAPFGELRMGVTRLDGRPTFVLAANRPGDAMPRVSGHGLPAGVAPALAVRFDTRRLAPLFEQALAAQGAPAEQRALLASMGLSPDRGYVGTLAYGVDDRRSHLVAVLEDYAALAEELGADPDRAIPASELRAIPRDVVAVESNLYDLAALGDMLETLAASTGAPADVWEQAERELGFHPRTDLLDHLGDTITVYRSDLTGGGGLMSTVALVGLDDPERIAATHAELVRRFNAEAPRETNGYVSIRTRPLRGRELFTLSFNGLPIPLQPSWGIAGRHLVVAASPTAVLAAMDQIDGDGPSILDREDLARLAGGSLEDLATLRYVDLPRMAARGYGTASLVATALANLVRSPGAGDDGRDVGLPMPSFAAFTEGVAPLLGTARWDGDDLVSHVRGDRSMLVALAGTVESLGGIAGLAATGAMVGGALPALEQARAAAREAQVEARLTELVTAIELHRLEHGRYPASLEELVDAGIAAPDAMASPAGEPGDGGPAIGYRVPTAGAARDDVVMLVDRAMLIAEDETFVAFADGSVERVWAWDLAERLKQPGNDGAIEALGLGAALSWYLDD